MNQLNNLFVVFLLLANSLVFGQTDQYNYQRELNGIKDQWHSINLPDDVFSRITNNLSDIRIFGYTNNGDTVESPYLIKLKSDKISDNDVTFSIINTSHNKNGYYFTFEVPSNETVNQIKLDFVQKNFDWKVNLEGSQNQQEWYSIKDDYRILSIQNELTDYQFTKLSFPDAKYTYYRLLIKSLEEPKIKLAKVVLHKLEDGNYKTYPISNLNISEDKKSKETEVNIDLLIPVSICQLNISIKDTFDFYRPITIQYLSDSVKTEKGWIYNYTTLANNTLNSLEINKFNFESRITKKLKIIIHNGDNQPLKIDDVEVKGYNYELLARFTETANYFLVYGNSKAIKPNYDIEKFTKNIPEFLTPLTLGIEQKISNKKLPDTEALFNNKNWLWAIMLVIILLLGWFSLKMIKKT